MIMLIDLTENELHVVSHALMEYYDNQLNEWLKDGCDLDEAKELAIYTKVLINKIDHELDKASSAAL